MERLSFDALRVAGIRRADDLVAAPGEDPTWGTHQGDSVISALVTGGRSQEPAVDTGPPNCCCAIDKALDILAFRSK